MSEAVQFAGNETTIDDVCDYVIVRLNEAATPLSVLKLHKLLYYIQAWHLAFYGFPLFTGRFQAWVHGPVSRHIYDRFKDGKSMYGRITRRDLRNMFSIDQLPAHSARHIDCVLEAYAEYADVQLEELTHEEAPWIDARRGHEPNERCENLISEGGMKAYYAARLEHQPASAI